MGEVVEATLRSGRPPSSCTSVRLDHLARPGQANIRVNLVVCLSRQTTI